MRKEDIKKKKRGRKRCYPGTQTDTDKTQERERERNQPLEKPDRWWKYSVVQRESTKRERNNKAQPRTRGNNSNWK